MAEMKTMLFVFAYLAALLGAVTLYRRLVLETYQIQYLHYGYNFVEAFVLAKVIVLGGVFGLGERFRDRPLIVPTVYKTICFSLLILGFSVMEHILLGWAHGKTTRASWDTMLDQGVWEILARTLVILMGLLPMFAVWETGRLLGKDRLYSLFFREARAQRSSPETSKQE
ncbi:MAG: hypothetical protein U0795_08775 [Pirellulales bacterium]